MFIRIFFVSLACFLMVGCASSNNASSGYSIEEMNEFWLKRNLTREGVVATDSGLQYKILKPSDGCKPDPDEEITVHYSMMSAKSKRIVDSSYERGYPDKFQLSKMIEGWQEGVPMMRVGEIWELYIPADLAYGSKGSPGSIDPDSLLISKVSLLDAHCLND